jgi:hypothetical protein
LFNAQKLDEIVNSALPEYQDRLGVLRQTAAGATASIRAFNSRGAWVTATLYQVRDLVIVSGIWYACVAVHTSGVMFVGDAANWRVHQGATREELADPTSASNGAGMVAYRRTQNYPTADTVGQQLGYTLWADLLTSNTGAQNDAKLLAAMNQVYNAGGGTVFLPAGNFSATSTSFNWAAGVTVNLKGAGQRATYLTKSGATTTAVLDLAVDVSVLDVYSTFSDFTIVGNAKAHHGLKATRLASITTRNLGIQGCDVGFENIGCLVAIHERPEWTANNIGFRSRKNTAGATIFCNQIVFVHGSLRGNSTLGIDLGDASSVLIDSTKLDTNGTAGNTATGGMMVRDTVDDESGFAQLTLVNAYFEANLGRTFQTENASGLDLTMINVNLISPESNRNANIGAIHCVKLVNCQCPSAGDAVVIGACQSSVIEGGTINTVTDSSVRQTRQPFTSAGGLNRDSVTSFTVGTGGLRIDTTVPVKDGGGVFTQGNTIIQFQDGAGAGNAVGIFAANGANGNAAATNVRTGTNSATGRSINAGGTINAAGADFAEYMRKAPGCADLPKGAVVGVTAYGLLTHLWADAVAFMVKSTSPSYVGGDAWFKEQAPILVLPAVPIATGAPSKPKDMEHKVWMEERAQYKKALQLHAAQYSEWQSEIEDVKTRHDEAMAEFESKLKSARQQVDRIAFAGQVPVNVVGAKPGDYIVPIQDGDHIAAVPIPSPTFDQYRQSVGRVIAIEPDGRARIIVKAS